ncbi:hypothetical protein [Psychroserpens sp.]|uniref:hypothetical protein n=1 Tax=Psychroserpens sp. TaxID=2020870 RepID=UPI0038594C52
MKYFLILSIAIFFFSCSSATLVDSWKNPEIESYEPVKILVVGLTPNKNVRHQFETQLQEEFELRGFEATRSVYYFENTLTSEEQLKALEYQLLSEGFDTILFTKTIGIENKILYKKNFDSYNETITRFKEDYLKYQDIYFNPEYYNEYKVYHAETAMYCICPTKERELIWKSYIDITDPQDVDVTVSDYVKLVIAALDAEQLINPIAKDKKTSTN